VEEEQGFLSENQSIGPYVISELLGKGSMGTVYAALQETLNRRVAIKFLPPFLTDFPQFVERFEREAEIIARLSHPNIISVYDRGKWKGHTYFVMEYVAGKSLADLLEEKGVLDWLEAVRIAKQICDGLGYAHSKRVIHRDVKPGNIMIDEKGVVKVTDFGISFIDDEGTRLTKTSSSLGTPEFMAPEQTSDSKKVDARADIYAVGGVLYVMLTGKVPFPGTTTYEVIQKVVGEEPTSPRKINETLNKDVEAVILKCLEKDPCKRYQTCEEMVQDLDACAQGLPVKAKKRTVFGQIVKWVQRNKKLVGSAAMAMLVAAGVIALLSQRRIREQEALRREAEIQAQKAKEVLETTAAKYEEERAATWSKTPSFEDNFEKGSLNEERWQLTGDSQGWHIEGGALTYFGREGALAWIRESVVGDFRLEIELELPGWTEEKLDENVRSQMRRKGLPLPPKGVSVVPDRDEWSQELTSGPSNLVSGVGLNKTMYLLATYIEIVVKESEGEVWRCHMGGIGVEEPRNPETTFFGSSTALVDPTGKQIRFGKNVTCDFGANHIVLTREGNRLSMKVGEETVLDEIVNQSDSVILGIATLDTTDDWLWDEGPVLGPTKPERAEVTTWQRIHNVRVYEKILANVGNPLQLAERHLKKGNHELAEQTYRSVIEVGLRDEMKALAHAGLAQALAGQGREEDAVEELGKATASGFNGKEKHELVKTLRRLLPGLRVLQCYEENELLDAWVQFVLWGDLSVPAQLQTHFNQQQVKKLFLMANNKDLRIRTRARQTILSLGEKTEVLPTPPLKTPKGCRACPWATERDYDGAPWASDVAHEKTGIQMVMLPEGVFEMGSTQSEEEQPVHEVRIERAFYIGAYEVTVEQFRRFTQETGYETEAKKSGTAYVWKQGNWMDIEGNWGDTQGASWRFPGREPSDEEPASCITWHDAKAYCEWANVRLPTEAEWEYACRAGTKTAFCFGNDDGKLDEYAWYSENSGMRAHPVGMKLENAWGIYDIYGNLWEWCEDVVHLCYEGAPVDGSAWLDGGDSEQRVLRGIGCMSTPMYREWTLGSSFRRWQHARSRRDEIGFRVVLPIHP